ncbi:hydroxyacylglutathione hydrolase [Pneumocystis carinii B80]|uniref:hydroxyacylglutathione hydrolase n=1 Tax=Pneumocystis carinii (strain B80) TaxID=1408658 RepID=A0A0W4ZMT9_PNEC8|nr:hydroxyacylglutathione hydrolase [Pneumocystis carinii B80]KTW29675.1 hydroxyacylglutathione hydrolase [Pneumocystis carinii B80]
MRIIPLEILRTSNYSYIIICNKTLEAAIVDPADPVTILPYLEKLNNEKIHLKSIITTHHHWDHAGGNKRMLKSYPDVKIYGGKDSEAVNHYVKDKEVFKIGEILVKSLHTPCHTRDSVCYYMEDGTERAVFTGDTLFNGGCGKFFEGTPEEMYKNLNEILGSLPGDTKIYPGHEYTKSNLKFAKTIFSSDKLFEVSKFADTNRITCGKFTINDEKTYNPFMMVNSICIQKVIGETDPVKVMKQLREMKNRF